MRSVSVILNAERQFCPFPIRRASKIASGDNPLRSKDPAKISESEIDAELNKLEALPVNDLKAVVEEAGIEKPGRGKPDILNKLRNRLTAAKRVMDEIQV